MRKHLGCHVFFDHREEGTEPPLLALLPVALSTTARRCGFTELETWPREFGHDCSRGR